MNYEEAIKLKPGTPILIKSKVIAVDSTGDIAYETRAQDQKCEVMYSKTDCRYVDIQPTEQKLDNYRKFKKGDIVKTVQRWGRKVPDAVDVYGYEVPGGPENKEWVVEEAETFGMVEVQCKVKDEFYNHRLPFFYLELVTTVEELKPYTVYLNGMKDAWLVQGKNGLVALYDVNRHPDAKAAAETECNRLNAEYRKEPAND